MSNTNVKYNLTVTPLWNTQNGNLMGIEITDEVFDAIQQVEKGGKLMVKFLDEDKRKSEVSPHAYLEYISKESVAEFKSKRPPTGAKQTQTNRAVKQSTPTADAGL